MKRKLYSKLKIPGAALFFSVMFITGWEIGSIEARMNKGPEVVCSSENWGLGQYGDEKQPQGSASAGELAKYNAYYVGAPDRKIIYLTFDCGYENGNTEAILDALKKHNAKAAFFVLGHFLESAPELVNRMVQEGHLVGNHTFHHPDMSAIASKEAFSEELESLEQKYTELTGKEMVKIYRPPQGKYSVENLKMAQELGYSTYFWSLAYVDWDVKNQPSEEEAFSKLTERVHPGAIVLLHNISSTNAAILDELMTIWESRGYSFGLLTELAADGEEQSEAATNGASIQQIF